LEECVGDESRNWNERKKRLTKGPLCLQKGKKKKHMKEKKTERGGKRFISKSKMEWRKTIWEKEGYATASSRRKEMNKQLKLEKGTPQLTPEGRMTTKMEENKGGSSQRKEGRKLHIHKSSRQGFSLASKRQKKVAR